MQELLIETIRTDGGVQSRERVDQAYVAELAEQITAGKKLPPCEVYNDGSDVWMADGFHRILAAARCDKRTIKCNVHKGTKDDAVWASCAANQAHGLRRSNADKQRAIKMALDLHPEHSDRRIADHCGVDPKTVASARNKAPDPAPKSRVGIDGKKRTHRPPPPASNRPKPPAPKAPAPKQDVRKDENGSPIPDHLIDLWDLAHDTHSQTLADLGRLRGLVKRAADVIGPEYLEGDYQSILTHLTNAYDAVKVNVPYVVCPWCHGNMSDQCRGCNGRGLIGKYRFDTTVPAELK